MKEGLLTMSLIEVERVTVIEQVIQKKIKQQAACQQLKLSAR